MLPASWDGMDPVSRNRISPAIVREGCAVSFDKFKSTTAEIIEEAKRGRMFVLVDDEERENEGDLVIPAQMATPEAVNFMAKHGRGLICLAMTRQRVEHLRLPLMPAQNQSRLS